MTAQKHESSSPQPAHDNVPLLANLNQLAMGSSHRDEWGTKVWFRWDVYDNHPD